jgi:hypothetical protein
MAYKKGKSADDFDFRAIALACGTLTSHKHNTLRELREKSLDTLRIMGAAVHAPEPLKAVPTAKSIDQTLLAVQKQVKGLNKAYAERCRLAVKAATVQQNKRYFSRLIGRLRHVSSEIPEGDRKPDAEGRIRRFYHVPVEIQDKVTLEELSGLQAHSEGSFEHVTSLFRAIALESKEEGLTAVQRTILRDIHERVLEKHRQPSFGRDDAVVSLPLQYQVFATEDRDIAQRIDQGLDALLLEDSTNTQYRFFADIANPVPRGPRIRLPLAVDAHSLGPLLGKGGKKQFTANSLTLELGPNGQVAVRLVVTKPRVQPAPLETFEYVLARDFGYKNTISLSLVKLEEALNREHVEQLQTFTKEQAHKFLSNHVVTREPGVAFRLRMSGEAFLARINTLTGRIESLTSRIDKAYKVVFAEKLALANVLGLSELATDEPVQLQKDMAPRGSELRKRISAFFGMLGNVKSLKIERRKLYKKIADIKKHWFGYLANIEVRLARDWNAVHVCEDLTNTAEEKDSPTYKGRVFNKMINHGARGQYDRRVNAKLAWNGVPGVALPSWYTSSTCFRHANVDKKQRQGSVFTCKRCLAEGRPKEHADEHAADTLGVYMTLVHKNLLSDTTLLSA